MNTYTIVNHTRKQTFSSYAFSKAAFIPPAKALSILVDLTWDDTDDIEIVHRYSNTEFYDFIDLIAVKTITKKYSLYF